MENGVTSLFKFFNNSYLPYSDTSRDSYRGSPRDNIQDFSKSFQLCIYVKSREFFFSSSFTTAFHSNLFFSTSTPSKGDPFSPDMLNSIPFTAR